MNIYGGCCVDDIGKNNLKNAKFISIQLELDDYKYKYKKDKNYGEYIYQTDNFNPKNYSNEVNELKSEYENKKKIKEEYEKKIKEIEVKIKDMQRILELNAKEELYIVEKGGKLNKIIEERKEI